jgi:uncharacterized membrane protein
MEVAGIEIPSDSPVFLSILAIHVPLGLLAVVTGAIYFWTLGALFATWTAPAAMRWANDYHLFVLGAVAFVAAIVGREVRRQRWRTRIDLHVVGMGVSYIAMLTAFYVDNGKNLPLWRDLSGVAYWLIPSAVGIPLIVRALARGPKLAIRAQGAAP